MNNVRFISKCNTVCSKTPPYFPSHFQTLILSLSQECASLSWDRERPLAAMNQHTQRTQYSVKAMLSAGGKTQCHVISELA